MNMRIRIGMEEMKRVKCFNYLGVDISAKGDEEKEILHRVKKGSSALGGVKEVWKKGGMTMGMKRRIYESVVIPKVMYESKVWGLKAKEKYSLEFFEMKGLRSMCGILLRGRIRNERIRERCGWDRSLISRYEQSILKWYGHVMRMNEDRLMKKVLNDVVEGR